MSALELKIPPVLITSLFALLMYLALMLALTGWGLYLANIFSLSVAVGFVFYMNRFQIQPEERALEKIFGTEFNDYKNRVRRWI